MGKKWIKYGLFLIILAVTGAHGAEHIPALVHVNVRGGEKPVVALFADSFISVLGQYSNLNTVRSHQITNFKDTGEPFKFLALNRLNGLIVVDITRENGSRIEGSIRCYAPEKKEARLLDEQQLSFDLADILTVAKQAGEKAAGLYPMREKNVVEKEEVERISVGKFEYIRPSLWFQLSAAYSRVFNNFYNENNPFTTEYDDIFTNQSIPILDLALVVDFRYRWYGWYVISEISPDFKYINIHTGPQFHFVKGLITFNPVWGYLSYTRTTLGNQFEFSGHSVGFRFLARVTSGYSLALGMSMIVGFSYQSDYSYQNYVPSDEWNLVNRFESISFSQMFRIKGDLYFNLDFIFTALYLNYGEGSTYASMDYGNSRLYLGVSYLWNPGVAK